MKKLKKRSIFFIAFILYGMLLQAQTIIIGTGSSFDAGPISARYAHERRVDIYKPSDGLIAGYITNLEWRKQNTSSTLIGIPVKIYLKEVPDSSLTSTQIIWDALIANAVDVFDGIITPPTTFGGINVAMQRHFHYSGTGNLMVMIATDIGGSGNSNANHYYYLTPNATVHASTHASYTTNGNITDNVSLAYTVDHKRPDIRISFSPTSNICDVISNLRTINVTSSNVNLKWKSNGTETQWLLSYKAVANTSWINVTATDSTHSLYSLQPNTDYEVFVRPFCRIGDTGAARSIRFATSQLTDQIPFTENFEGTPNWILVNGTQTNKWHIGTAANNTSGGTRGLYISNNNGSYAFTSSQASNVYATKLIQFAHAGNYVIEYDWKSFGMIDDYVQVWLAPENSVVTAGSPPTTTNWINLYGNSNLETSPEWEHKLITFDISQPGVYKLVIYWKNNNMGGIFPAAIDNISIREITCPEPIGISVDEISVTNANIHFHLPVNARSVWIYYKPETAITWDSVDIYNYLNDTVYLLSGLQGGTTYQYYLKTDCFSEYSFATDIYTFKTQCDIIASLPWSESFEEITAPNEIPGCMAATNLMSFVFSAMSPDSIQNRFAKTGNNYAFFTWDCNDYIFTPRINLTAGISYRFSFWYITGGHSGWERLEAKACVGQRPQDTIVTIGAPLTNVTNITYQKFEADFIPDTTGSYVFAIYCKSNSDPYYLTIDDLHVEATPICSDNVNNLKLLGFSDATTAKICWSSTGTNFNIEYRDTSETIWHFAGQTTDTVFSLTNLNMNTQYEVRVQADCGNGILGNFSTLQFSSLPCTPLASVDIPIREGFDSVITPSLPACWKKIVQTSWAKVITASSNYVSSPNSLNLYDEYSSTLRATLLLSPPISPSVSVANLRTRFFVQSEDDGNIQVGIMTNPSDLSTFICVDTVVLAAGHWIYTISDFSMISQQPDNVWYIAYKHGNTITRQDIFIDEINIEAIPPCPDALNVRYTHYTNDSIFIRFSSMATNFNIAHRAEGSATWTTVATSDTIFGIGGLQADTRYEIKVQSICGADSGIWSYPIFCKTSQIPATIPFAENFETLSEWILINGSETNKWHIGAAANTNNTAGGIYGLYISNDNGLTNAYSINDESHVYAVKVARFNNAGDYNIEYDWKLNGEECCDYLQVWLAPVNDLITAGSSPNTSNWINLYGDANLSLRSTWQHKQMIFAVSQPGIYKIVFYWNNNNSGGNQTPAAIDNISVTALPCSRPQNVKALNIGPDSVILAWNSPIPNFVVEYKSVSDTSWTTVNNVASTTITLRNLTPYTNYQVRIKALCSVGDTSLWTNIYNFKTICFLEPLPIRESFEATGTTSPSVPNCWSYVSAGGSMFGSTNYSHTGQQSYKLELFPSPANEAMLISPYLSANINTLRIKFWMRYSTTPNCKIKVGYMSDPTNASTFREVTSFDVPTTWTEFVVPFDTVTGTGHFIAISAKKQGAATVNHIHIDDITIGLIPACADISGVNITDTSQTSATVNWNNASSATAYEVQYKTIEATQWTTAPAVTINTCVLTGLQASSGYQVRVRTKCNVSDSGEWSDPVEFYTFCGTTSLPFAENFNSATFPPHCWSKHSGMLNLVTPIPVTLTVPNKPLFTWNPIAFGNVAGGSKSACLNVHGSNVICDWLITPTINLENTGNAVLEFDLAMTAWGGANPATGTRSDDKFMVLVSNNGSWTSSNIIAVWDNVTSTSRIFNDISMTGDHIVIPLTEMTGNVQIAFYGVSTVSGNGDNALFIDNVKVFVGPPVCRPVTTIATAATGTSVKVDWTAPAGQTQWKVSCLQAGTPVASQIVSTATYTFAGLQRGAAYTFEVRNICGAGDTSVAVASAAVTINQCNDVSNVTVVRACPTTAIISFTAEEGQTQWQLSYKQTPAGDALTKIINKKRDTLTGLMPNASYEVMIRPVCGAGDTGIYDAPVTLQTGTCIPVENLTVPRIGLAIDTIFASWYNNECHQSWEINVVPQGSPRGDEFITTNTYQGIGIKVNNPGDNYDVYVRGNCGDGEYSEWVMTTSLGIENIALSESSSVKVILAPNPARDYTQLSIEGVSGEVEMNLLTLEGKLLKKEILDCRPTLTKDIRLQGLSKGTYLIRLTHKNWTKIEKLIVQ